MTLAVDVDGLHRVPARGVDEVLHLAEVRNHSGRRMSITITFGFLAGSSEPISSSIPIARAPGWWPSRWRPSAHEIARRCGSLGRTGRGTWCGSCRRIRAVGSVRADRDVDPCSSISRTAFGGELVVQLQRRRGAMDEVRLRLLADGCRSRDRSHAALQPAHVPAERADVVDVLDRPVARFMALVVTSSVMRRDAG